MSQLLTTFRTWKPKEKALVVYFSVVTAIYLIWLGGLKITEGELKQIDYWLGGSPVFSSVLSWLGTSATSVIMLVIEVLAGVLLLAGISRPKAGAVGATMASVIFALNFMYLFTNPVWIGKYGRLSVSGSRSGHRQVPLNVGSGSLCVGVSA